MDYAKTFPLYENDTVCGSVSIGCDGLRCRFDCRCTPAGNGILRIYLKDMKGCILNLGPVVDDGAGFGTRRTLTRTELSALKFDVYNIERCLLRNTPPDEPADAAAVEAPEPTAAKAEPEPEPVFDEEPVPDPDSEGAPEPVIAVEEEPAPDTETTQADETLPETVQVSAPSDEPDPIFVPEEKPEPVSVPEEEFEPVFAPAEEPDPVFAEDAAASEPAVSLPEPEENPEVFPGAAAFEETSELPPPDTEPAVKKDFESEAAFREDGFHLYETDSADGDLQQWKLCARPSDICRDEALLSALSLADEVWMLREGDSTWLGVPFDRNRPFGLHPAFTVARPVMVENRLFAAVLVDRDGAIVGADA